MKHISDEAKKRRGYGTFGKPGSPYKPWIKASEVSSRGIRTIIHDPIEGRAVHVRSEGERMLFHLLRFSDRVAMIREQVNLDMDMVAEICEVHGWPKPSGIWSTDLLVLFTDDSMAAFSVKDTQKVLTREYYKTVREYNKIVRRQAVEQEYYERIGVSFHMIFKEQLPVHRVRNLSYVMSFYNDLQATTREEKLLFLIARKIVSCDLDSGPVPFGELARRLEIDIDMLYDEAVKEYG